MQVPRDWDVGLGAGSGSQTVTATSGGTVTANPLPAGAQLVIALPGTAVNTTVEDTGGVSSVSQGCFDNASPCTLTLNGFPGLVTASWNETPIAQPGQPAPPATPASEFTVVLQGAGPMVSCGAGMIPNPAYYTNLALFGTSSAPPCIPLGQAPTCGAGQVLDPTTGTCVPKVGGTNPNGCSGLDVKDQATGACVPACWDGTAPANGACPPAPKPTPKSTTSTGTYVAVGAGVLALGAGLYYALK